jgi:hypothetical protein
MVEFTYTPDTLASDDIVDGVTYPVAAMSGVDSYAVALMAGIEPDDRTENLATTVADASGLRLGATTNVLLALSHVEWAKVPEHDRAQLVEYCARLLGSVGLTVIEMEQ